MKKTLIISLFTLSVVFANAQEIEPSAVNFGLGIGLSYGGIVGGRLSVFPAKQFGLFAAAGYNLDKMAFNVGGIARLRPQKKFCPNLLAMYGYNAVIVVSGTDKYNKTYYGPTVGVGGEIRFGEGQTFLNVELLIPFRSDAFREDMDAVLNDPTVTNALKPPPFGICVGYHFGFRSGY